MEKRLLVYLSLVLILSLSFVSAGFFSDVWNKVTGQIVEDCTWSNGCCNINEDCSSDAPYCVQSGATEGPAMGVGICNAGYAGHYCDKSEGSGDCMSGVTCNLNCDNYEEMSWCSPMIPDGDPTPGGKTRCASCYEEDGICIGVLTCTDSDGGKNYYVKGTATNMDYPSDGTDQCLKDRQIALPGQENILHERYCREDGFGSYVSYDCPEGCADGVCVGGKKSSCNNGVCTLYEGENVTQSGHNFELSFMSSTEVALKIDDMITNLLEEGEIFLYEDIKITINDIIVQSYVDGLHAIEFSVSEYIQNCTDSDWGKDYYVKGSCIDSGEDLDWDFCQDGTLYEMYCTENFDCNNIQYKCPNECEDGACIVTSICTDSDEKDYYNKGHVKYTTSTGFESIEYDYCSETVNGEQVLNEMYCYDNGTKVAGISTLCKLGYLCKDGACVVDPCDANADGVISTTEKINCENICVDSDDGIFPFVKGKCVDSRGVTANDGCLSEDGAGPQYEGAYVAEAFCLTDNMREHCKIYNSDDYCENLPDDCYASSLIPQKGLAWTYFDRDEKYFCPNGCKDGVCVEESGSCQELINKVRYPSDFVIQGVGYSSNWNRDYSSYWWIDGEKYSYTEYSAGWYTNYDSKYYYISYYLDVFDDKNVNLESWLKDRTDNMACNILSYYSSEEKRNKIYVCNWDILSDSQSIDNYQSKDREVLWVKDNVAIMINLHSGNRLSDEEVAKIISKKISEFLEDLENNRADFVEWEDFQVDYPLSRLIEEDLSDCPSEIPDSTCSPCWSCKTEPVVCPPHGTQTKTCVDHCCDSPNREEIRQCSPGICAGCYIPRWFGDKYGNNKCIPYGFRFEHQTGWSYNLVEMSDDDILEERDSNDYKLEIFSESKAVLTLYGRDGESYVYNLVPLEEVEISIPDWDDDIQKITLKVNKIYYEEGGEKNYIDLTLKYIGYQRELNTMNAYCDIDGRVKQQKTTDYQGNWAKCQNNYECESNVCSSGECIELQKMLNEVSRFKSLGVRVLCRLAHLFSEDNYNTCVFNFLGEEVPSGGGGGGGPPPMPE